MAVQVVAAVELVTVRAVLELVTLQQCLRHREAMAVSERVLLATKVAVVAAVQMPLEQMLQIQMAVLAVLERLHL
jgi:hypothetical protein